MRSCVRTRAVGRALLPVAHRPRRPASRDGGALESRRGGARECGARPRATTSAATSASPRCATLVDVRARPRLDAARLRGRHRREPVQGRLEQPGGDQLARGSAGPQPRRGRERSAAVGAHPRLVRRRAPLPQAVRGRRSAKARRACGSRWAASSTATAASSRSRSTRLLTVAWGDHERAWLDIYADDLRAHGGTAGCLAEDLPAEHRRATAGQRRGGRLPPLARQRDDVDTGVWPATCGSDPESRGPDPGIATSETSMPKRRWHESRVELRRG